MPAMAVKRCPWDFGKGKLASGRYRRTLRCLPPQPPVLTHPQAGAVEHTCLPGTPRRAADIQSRQHATAVWQVVPLAGPFDQP